MKKLKFEGIDSWNRPIFKDIESKQRFGSVMTLFKYHATEEEVLEKVDEFDLLYFGNSFDCEPMGSGPGEIKIIREPSTIHGLIYKYERMRKKIINPDDLDWVGIGFGIPPNKYNSIEDYLENGEEAELDCEQQISIGLIDEFIAELKKI